MGRRSEKLSQADGAGSPYVGDGGADKQFVSTLANGISILRAFHPEGAPLGNKELAARTNLGPATVTRLTYTLSRQGLLEYLPERGKYRLAVGILPLVYPLLAQIRVRQIADPYMRRLAETLNGNVSLAMPAQLDMVFIHSVRNERGMVQPPDVGRRFPMHIGASGRAYLAICGETERRDLLAALEREHAAQDWPELREEIEAEVERFHAHGFTISTRARQGVHAMAAHVSGERSEAVFISCGIPEFEIRGSDLVTELAPRMVSALSMIRAAIDVADGGLAGRSGVAGR